MSHQPTKDFIATSAARYIDANIRGSDTRNNITRVRGQHAIIQAVRMSIGGRTYSKNISVLIEGVRESGYAVLVIPIISVKG